MLEAGHRFPCNEENQAKTIVLGEANGTEIAFVPLGRLGQEMGMAIIDVPDLQLLEKIGLSLSWNMLKDGYVTAPARKSPGRSVLVARVLLDAGPGEAVFYSDNDPKNLRRSNLRLTEGWGGRRDRDYITPKEKQKPRRKVSYVAANPAGVFGDD